jgi:hypothetical protein
MLDSCQWRWSWGRCGIGKVIMDWENIAGILNLGSTPYGKVIDKGELLTIIILAMVVVGTLDVQLAYFEKENQIINSYLFSYAPFVRCSPTTLADFIY